MRTASVRSVSVELEPDHTTGPDVLPTPGRGHPLDQPQPATPATQPADIVMDPRPRDGRTRIDHIDMERSIMTSDRHSHPSPWPRGVGEPYGIGDEFTDQQQSIVGSRVTDGIHHVPNEPARLGHRSGLTRQLDLPQQP